MSAVGELVQGERRGRWLVAAVACGGPARALGRPGAGDGRGDPRKPADHLRQRQRSAAGRVRRQPYRRVLLSGGGTRQRGAEHRDTPTQRLLDPSRSTDSWARRSTRTRPPASAVTAARATRGSSARATRPAPRIRAPTSGSTRPSRTSTARPTWLRVHRDVQRRRPGAVRAASTRPLTSTSPVTTPAWASSIKARPAKSAASTKRRVAQGASWSSTPAWDHYQEGRYGDVFAVIGNRRAPSATRSTRRSSTTASACSGTSRAWRWAPTARSTSSGASGASPPDLALTAATKAQGQIATATVTARNSDGNAAPGRSVRLRDHRRQPGRRRCDDGRRRNGHDHVGRRERRHGHPHRVHRHERQRGARCRRGHSDSERGLDAAAAPASRASPWS